MNERVVDASALAYALMGRTPEAEQLRRTLTPLHCHAPHLIDAELGSVLRRRVRAGDLTSTSALTVLDAARDVISVRHPHTGAVAALAWTLRDNLSFYDALYVALAVRLDIPLVTGDQRLAHAPGLRCAVELA